MDPIDLTCPKCGAAWKLVKAGDGPIACPKCKAPIGPGSPAPPVAADDPPQPMATPAPALPVPEVSDADDPGLVAPAHARMPTPVVPRRGRHPLVTVAVVLLLILLIPLALVACLFAVCAVMFRGM